jgi:hypothetical protein
MINILEVEKDYDSMIKINMDLNMNFYKELKKFYFFRKTYEIHLQKISLK